MKKLIISAMLLMACIFTAKAQENVLSKGTTIANIGVGLPQLNSGYSMTIPPISASFEHGVAEFGRPGSIGVGAYVGFWGYQDKVEALGSSVASKYFDTVIGVRGAYHFTIVNNWEVYAGVVVGADIASSKLTTSGIINSSSNSDTTVGFGYQAFAGTRIMFGPSVGAFAEVGYGVSYANIGLTFRF